MKNTTMLLIFMIIGVVSKGQSVPFKSISSEFPLVWKTKMGNTTYRTNVQFTNESLVIGSNGNHYMDYLLDEGFGVYVIDRVTGKKKAVIANEGYGDMDVNGVLVFQDKLYFGNDNEEFLCTNIKGEILWRKATSGDVEHEPSLITNNGKKYIVYATETGEVRAVNPINGNTVWNYYSPNFSGWKPTDSRFIFKVKAYCSNGYGFFTKPKLADLNGDKIDDLVYKLYYGKIICINGATGEVLWENEKSGYSKDESIVFNYNGSPAIFETEKIKIDNIKRPVNYGWGTYMGYSYKNMVSIYDRKGTVIKQFNNPVSNSYRGLNSLFTSNKVLVPTPDSLLIYENNKLSFVSTAISCTYKNWNDKVVTESRGVNSLIADKIFKYKNHENCVLLVSQGDRMVENKGFITIVSLDTKKVVARLQLPHTTEFAPVIEDVNLDGKLDVLINCRDGYLYCFDLNVAAANNQKLAATK